MTGTLDVARKAMVNRPFSHFVPKEDQNVCYRHRKLLFETVTRQACDLWMVKEVESRSGC